MVKREMTHPMETELETRAKLVFLKAHLVSIPVLVGLPCTNEESLRSSPAQIALKCTGLLGDAKSIDGLFRRLFYTSILAECTRLCDPSEYRSRLEQICKFIETQSPTEGLFELYHKLVNGTTTIAGSGDHDIDGSCCTHITLDADILIAPEQEWQPTLVVGRRAIGALGLADGSRRRNERFLNSTPLAEVARKHGLWADGAVGGQDDPATRQGAPLQETVRHKETAGRSASRKGGKAGRMLRQMLSQSAWLWPADERRLERINSQLEANRPLGPSDRKLVGRIHERWQKNQLARTLPGGLPGSHR